MAAKKQIDFASLSEEEVAKLNEKDRAAYDAWLAAGSPETSKEKAAPAPKEIGVYRNPTTREVTDLVLPHPNAKTPKEKAANYFVEHESYTLDEVIVCDDGTVFPGTQRGQNNADNYCATNKVGQHKYSR